MSSDSHILGAATASGAAATGIAAATHSDRALLIGALAGLAVLIILGFIARKLAKRSR